MSKKDLFTVGYQSFELGSNAATGGISIKNAIENKEIDIRNAN